MNKIHLISTCLLFIAACSPDTKNTNRILGFKLSSDIKKVDKNREINYNPTGDGTLYIEYTFSNADTAKLIKECLANNFLKLPINEKNLIDGAIFQHIDRSNNRGYYKLNLDKNGMSYSIGVIDLSKNKIYIYESLY